MSPDPRVCLPHTSSAKPLQREGLPNGWGAREPFEGGEDGEGIFLQRILSPPSRGARSEVKRPGKTDRDLPTPTVGPSPWRAKAKTVSSRRYGLRSTSWQHSLISFGTIARDVASPLVRSLGAWA
jgi:hypothetical protein